MRTTVKNRIQRINFYAELLPVNEQQKLLTTLRKKVLKLEAQQADSAQKNLNPPPLSMEEIVNQQYEVRKMRYEK